MTLLKKYLSRSLYRLGAILLISTAALALTSSKCGESQDCMHDAQNDQYDFRGQSTFMRMAAGDTSRIKVILYSNNDVRIALCKDAAASGATFRVIHTVREYSRAIDRIEKKVEPEPVYKLSKAGKKIPVKVNGKAKLDAYGETVFEIERYRNAEHADTIWRTDRNVREETIFDSKKSGNKYFYENSIDKTMSVIIEVAMPLTANAKKAEECVGVMVGRKFRGASK